MNARVEVAEEAEAGESTFAFEQTFRDHYRQLARLIDRILGDRTRSEELAVDVLLKLWMTPSLQTDLVSGWLYRSAAHRALDELRRRTRRARYEALFGFGSHVPTPEELNASTEEQRNVRLVLTKLKPRDAELLVLQSEGLTYRELSAALHLNPTSVGALLNRAQLRFKKEYIQRYGQA